MEDTEQQDTLVLRLESEEVEGESSQNMLPTTQTSCITMADSECSQTQVSTQDQDPISQESTVQDELEQTPALVELNSNVKVPQTARPNHDGESDPKVVGQIEEARSQVVAAGPATVNAAAEGDDDVLAHDFEVTEMDMSFLRGDASEVDGVRLPDQPKSRENEADAEADKDDQVSDGSASAKSGDSEHEDESGGESDHERRDDDDDELKEAMAETDDCYDEGPGISLPYKEPEQISLKEFLARRRSKRASATQATVPATDTTGTGQGLIESPLVDNITHIATTTTTSSSSDHAHKGQPEVEPQPASEQAGQQRKSKLHEEILKAAAKVTPQLSRDNIIDAPVDRLIQRAIVMNRASEEPRCTKDPVPGAQLQDLKARLKAKITEQRRKSRLERSAAANEADAQDEEYDEDEADLMTEDEDDDECDEDTIIDKAAKEDGDGMEDEDENDIPEEEEEPPAVEEVCSVDDNQAEAEMAGETNPHVKRTAEGDGLGTDEPDSDIEDVSLRRSRTLNKKGTRKINAVPESDSEQDDEQEKIEPNVEEELNLCLDEDDDEEEDATFMHLSQTQRPKTQLHPAKGKQQQQELLSTELFADATDGAAGEVDDDLLALCSGRFATQKGSDIEGNDEADDDDDDDGDDGSDDASGGAIDDEVDEEPLEDDEEQQATAAHDDDDDDGGVDNEDEELRAYRKSLRVENSEDEDDHVVKTDATTARSAKDFFEGEAELSGSDVGSDDEDDDGMTEEEKRQLIKDLIDENPDISDEQVQEQVTRLHMKRMHADDQRELRLYKEMYLADGELHSDGPGRERRFRWTNLSSDFVGGSAGNDDSGESGEEETEEEAKWKARRLEREKQKLEHVVLDCPDDRKLRENASAIEDGGGGSLVDDANISRVLREANKALKIAQPRKGHDAPAKRPVSGGFLSMTGSVLEKIADKVKGSGAKDMEGSHTTKNFVFRTVEKKAPEVASGSVGKGGSIKRSCVDVSSAKGPHPKKAKVDSGTGKSTPRSIFTKF